MGLNRSNMQIRTMGPTPPPRPPKALLPPSNNGQIPPEEPDPELGEKIFRYIGRGSKMVSMVPKALESQPWLKPLLHIEDADAKIKAAAGLAGTVGMISLGVAGGMEMADGVRHKNKAELLAGASEVARGVYVGSWTAQRVLGEGHLAPTMGIVSGALQTAAGLCRLTHKKNPNSKVNPKIVGLLEAGQGLTWIGSIAGFHTTICLASRMVMVSAKWAYTNQDKFDIWEDRTGA